MKTEQNKAHTHRSIPQLVESVLEKNIPVVLHKNGFLIGGFYGANYHEKVGYVLIEENDKKDGFNGYDHKGKKHPINIFKDLVALNNHVWKGFYKQENHKKADPLWFSHLYETGLLSIAPTK